MRILFVYPRMPRNLTSGNMPPLAVLSLASFMKREGHDVRVYERNIDKKCVSEMIDGFGPDAFVCTLLLAQQIADMQIVCKELRALRPGIPILCGGLTASLIPELILQEGLVDYIGIGEGEYTLMELLEVVSGRRDPSTVQSLVYLDPNGQPVHTPLRPFANLADFPDTDFSLLPMDKYFSYFPKAPHTLGVYASKGCPCQCTFCFNAAYHRCQYRARVRASVMREIESLVSDCDADGILFFDELWGVDKEELRAYCNDIASLSERLRKPIRWGCQTSIGVLRLEDMKCMADSGCWFISFGLESGSPEVLKRVKKGYALTKVETDANNCKAAGMCVMLNAIFGFPDETPAQIKQTVHTIFRLNPTIYATGLFYVSPGTEEYNKLVSSGRLKPPGDLAGWSEVEERRFMETNYSAIPDRELKVIHYFFYWRTLFQDRKDQKASRLDFIKIGLRRVVDQIGRKGFFYFIFKHFRLALYSAWYYYAFPGIRKKYDLYPRNFGRKDWDDLGHLEVE